MSDTSTQQLREKVAVLAGERGDASRHALRRGDAKVILEFIAGLRSTASGMKTNVDGLGKALTDASLAIAELEASGTTLGGSLTEIRSDITSLKTRVQTLETNYGTLRSDADALEAVVNGIQDRAGAITPPTLEAAGVGGPPTQNDHNRVVSDIQRLNGFMNALKSAVTG